MTKRPMKGSLHSNHVERFGDCKADRTILRCLLLLISVIYSVGESYAEPRFFKANSLTFHYRWYAVAYYPTENGDRWEQDDVYYGMTWLGNDTIVEGRKCVEVWDKLSEDEDASLRGFVYEDSLGYVWERYRNWGSTQIGNEWLFLCDFSCSDWSIGDYIIYQYYNNVISKDRIEGISEFRLLTGETLPVFETFVNNLVYGLGYLNSLPLYPYRTYSVFRAQMLSIYRNGQLIYDAETGIDKPVVPSLSKIGQYYDLTGRPTDGIRKGIYIKDGRKVIIK